MRLLIKEQSLQVMSAIQGNMDNKCIQKKTLMEEFLLKEFCMKDITMATCAIIVSIMMEYLTGSS